MARSNQNQPNTSLDTTVAALRKNLEGLPITDLAGALNQIRGEQTDRLLQSFEDAWRQVERTAEEHQALTGFALPVPARLENVFEDAPEMARSRGSAKPDAWYAYEINNIITFGGDDGGDEQFIADFISARGGDGRYAVRTIIPALAEQGFIAGSSDLGWFLTNSRDDAWYDYNVMVCINDADMSELPTTKQIHDYIIDCGGHGAEAVRNTLPRLMANGRIREVGEGRWDVTNRKSEAWYDYTITAFVSGSAEDTLPTTKQIHDFVIDQGGHGAIAVAETLPRLADCGHLIEVEDGVWDYARRRPEAWYDYTVLSYFNEHADGEPVTTMDINEFAIEQGGHGAHAVSHTLPRLVAAGKISDLGDGTWELAGHKPRAWYDHTVISQIRAAEPGSLPTLKQLHDRVIELGGHGAVVPTTVLPDLIASGEIIEVDTGIYDVTNRRSDVWFDQTVLEFVEQADGPVSTMQVYEHVMEQGGHGAEVASIVLPRLTRAGLIEEGDQIGTWQLSHGLQPAFIESQVLAAVRGAGASSLTLEDCLEQIDEELADETIIAPAFERLESAGLIEACDDSDEGAAWRIPGTKARKNATPQRRRRRTARAA